jgi:chromosomal replication initiator protein
LASSSASALWTTALGQLQLEVTRHTFETWLKDTTGLDYADGRFAVAVPNTFVAEYLERRLAPLITKTLRGILQQDVAVSVQVRQPANDTGAPNGAEGPASLPSHPRPRQRSPLSGGLNPRYTFDTFVVGKSNRFAHAAAIAVADDPGATYNPLVIHAGVGLGKTHLLHAIGHSARANSLTTLYASAEQYTNEFITALREGRLEPFREKYRTLDVLLIDDIQFIAGKEHSRESFFHTFNDLHTASKQIVISTDTSPKFLSLLDERLKSRLEAGLTADILPPDLETRMAILEKKALEERAALAPEVVDFLARKFVRNVRELEGALNRIIAMARLTDRPIDLQLASQAVADLTSTSRRLRRTPPQQILTAAAAYFDLSLQDLTGKSRKKGIALARQVAAYILREDTDRSLAEIGHILGDRGHSTALRAHDKVATGVNLNTDLRRYIADIRDRIDRTNHQSA